MKNHAVSKGMKAAQRRGVRIGRPVNATQERDIAIMARTNTAPEISRMMGIPQSTVYAIIARLKKAQK